MENKKILIKAGIISRILVTTFLLSLLLMLAQVFILQISASFIPQTYTSLNQIPQDQNQPMDRQYRIQNSARLFLPDGTIHLAITDNQSSQDLHTIIYDLNDNLVWQGSHIELPEKYLKWSQTEWNHLSKYVLLSRNAVYPDLRKSILIPIMKGMKLENLWRYEDSGGCFAGYDTKGNRIGYIGSKGFTEEKSQVQFLEQPKG